MKYFALIFIAFYSISAFAQGEAKDEELQTLFGSAEEIEHGGYGSVDLKVGEFLGQTGVLAGFRGCWTINHTFSMGFAGYWLFTAPDKTIETIQYEPENYYMRTGYGGLFLEYAHKPNNAVHFTLNALVGAGGAFYTRSWRDLINDNWDDWWVYDNSAYFIFEPGAGVELNMTKFFRIELGASYRIVEWVDLEQTVDSDLEGASFNLSFKFGSF